jgi:hypothetical protein
MRLGNHVKLTFFGLFDTSFTRELITGVVSSVIYALGLNDRLRLIECGLTGLSLKLYIEVLSLLLFHFSFSVCNSGYVDQINSYLLVFVRYGLR